MKPMIISSISLVPAVITAFILTSCIYDAPGDRFYRTLWKSQDPVFGTITLDFLCDGAIAVKSTSAQFDDYGTYQSDGLSASLMDLSLIIDDTLYQLKEAYRNEDILFLTVYNPAQAAISIVRMARLSAYED